MSEQLFQASICGHISWIKALIDGGIDVNSQRDSDGATALALASYNGHKEVVEILLQRDVG